ncbi:type IV secretory system conjugative DNA transfer family protein [Streptomyces sp. NPDC050145]|uniref:type IV secretory system conjugative DNA transfer family protein n=1 Tax=Streptomyces sp. NPDC050145 TaxID=3365602 RepID=UPI00378C5DDF
MRESYERREEQRRGGGVPDGLLIGVLAFVLGMTVLVWSATGLAGLFAKGAWPDGVTFGHTPPALRSLITAPHDIAAAWPSTPESQLSGYGLVWGLLISQVLIGVVLTIFVAGTFTRWRAVRKSRRSTEAPRQERGTVPSSDSIAGREDEPRKGRGELREQPPPAVDEDETATWQTLKGRGAVPVSDSVAGRDQPPPAEQVTETPAEQTPPSTPVPPPRTTGPLLLGPAPTRRTEAVQAIQDAPGAALIVTSSPEIWQETKDARAKLGPVLLYDPSHLCDTPARLHWNPASRCEDRDTAAARAAALLAPVRPTAKLDSALAETAETLLRSYLHAAAAEGKPFRHVHRWAQGTQVQEAVRILRTNPKAASGAAGELEAALTSHPERRDMAQELTARALSALFSVHVREACTPNRADSLVLDSFVDEGGTLYVVGEPIENPRQLPGAMPLLTALASSVVEHGRRMAERSPAGRLDPPMTLVLDDVAAVAPLPQLPELLSSGADRGLVTLALLRSREQARTRWPDAELPVG